MEIAADCLGGGRKLWGRKGKAEVRAQGVEWSLWRATTLDWSSRQKSCSE